MLRNLLPILLWIFSTTQVLASVKYGEPFSKGWGLASGFVDWQNRKSVQWKKTNLPLSVDVDEPELKHEPFTLYGEFGTAELEKDAAIYIPSIYGKVNVYIDGELKLSRGRSIAGVYLPVRNDQRKIEILLQIKNDYYLNTYVSEIQFLSHAQMVQDREYQHMMVVGLAVVLLLLAFYYACLFLFRRSEKIYLAFASFLLVGLYRHVYLGPELVRGLLPDTGYFHILARLDFLSVYLSYATSMWYMSQLISSPKWNPGIRFIRYAGVFFGFLSLLPIAMHQPTLPIFQLFAALMTLWFVITAIRLLEHTEMKIVFFFTLAIVGAVANDILYQMHIINTGFFIPYSIVSFIIGQSVLLGYRFSQNFTKTEFLNIELEEQKRKIESINKNLEKIVAEKTANIRSVFNSINQAIFTIDDDKGQISAEKSGFYQKIFKKDYSTIFDLLNDTDLDEESKSLTASCLISAIDDDALSFKLNMHVLPKKMVYRGDQEQTIIISAIWEPIEDEDGVVRKILVCMRDISSEEKAMEKAKDKEEEIEILLETLQNPLDVTHSHLNHLMDMAEKLKKDYQKNIDYEKFVALRILHTIKGNSRMVGLSGISKICHSVENNLKESETGEQIRDNIQEVIHTIQKYHKTFKEKIYVQNIEYPIHLSKDEAIYIVDSLQKYAHENQDLIKHLESQYLNKFKYVMNPIAKSLEDLANKLGKKTPNVEIKGEEIEIPDQYNHLLISIFNHFFRNSMDHGIESPEERLAKGKSDSGVIKVDLVKENGVFTIQYQDDGRGLNLQVVEERLLTKKLEKPENLAKLSPIEVAEKIFLPGFTTKEEANEISGRGIGLDAVKDILSGIGGSIHCKLGPKSRDGSYSLSVEMTLPEVPEFKHAA